MSSLPASTRQWILSNKPSNDIVLDGPEATFTLHTADLPSLGPDQVLLKTIYFSNDPAQRAWIQKDVGRLYTEPVPQGDVMHTVRCVMEVLASKHKNYKAGQHCIANPGWTEYIVVDGKDCMPINDIPGLSETHWLGALGSTGLTAYYGTKVISEVKPGDVVVVSGAAGGTGSMVVQIAKKLLGAKKVVGIAGTEDKCRWVEKIGADVCVNYKAADFAQKLEAATEGYADVFFDNTGGVPLDVMLTRMKVGGRVTVCGVISSYNSAEKIGPKNWFEVVSSRLNIKGFIVTDYIQKGGAMEAIGALIQGYKDGKLLIGDDNETIVDAKFEDVPKTWLKLFSGGNSGKLLTKVV